MAKLTENKQEKLTDLFGRLPEKYVEESTEEALLRKKTERAPRSHAVLRWVLVAVVAVMIVGAMFAASIFGNIAWKRNHPEGTSDTYTPGGTPGADFSAGYHADKGAWVLSEAWADYAQNVGADAKSLEKVYAFAFQLRETGQPVEIERNIFVDRFVSCYRKNVFGEDAGNTLTVRPDTGFPLYGEEERETYLYFLATLTNCLGDHVYYADYNYQISMNRYPFTVFEYTLQDFPGGFQKAKEDGNAQIQRDSVYTVKFIGIAVSAEEQSDFYTELRESFVPNPITVNLQTTVGKTVSIWFAEMVTNYRTAGELIIPLDTYEDYLGIPDFLENYPGEIFDHAPEINLTGEEMQKYSETYFSENSLIAVLTMEGSEKTKYTAAAARQDGKIQITIDKTYPFKKVLWLTPKITLVEVEGKCAGMPIEIINRKNETEPDPYAQGFDEGSESAGTTAADPVAGYRDLDITAGVDVYFGARANHVYSCMIVARNDPRRAELAKDFWIWGDPANFDPDVAPGLELYQVAEVLAAYNLKPEDVRLLYQPIMISSYIGTSEQVEKDVAETLGSEFSGRVDFSASAFPSED